MKKVKNCYWCNSTELKKIAERKDGVGVNECNICGLILVAETPEDLSVYYRDEDYFNPDGETETGYHENYDLISPFYLYWQGALIEEISRVGKKTSLLEVGCATGNALEMVKLRNNKLSIYGIDLSDYAIKVCREKHIPSSVSKINGFKSKNKFDIILSSETMEHVDELREFVEGVKENLSEGGIYVFFVPAVERESLIKQSNQYPSLTTSLEHVSYFTKSFLQKSLEEAFGASVYVHQIPTGGDGDNYHLGYVSLDSNLVDYMEKFTKGFIEKHDDTFKGTETLFNLGSISAKFSKFNISEQYFNKLMKLKDSSERAKFLEAEISYGKGELIKAKKYFEDYLGEHPADNFILKVFLTVERQYNQFLLNDIEKYRNEIDLLQEVHHKLTSTDAELKDLKNSKIVGSAIKVRKGVGATLDPVRRFKKKT